MRYFLHKRFFRVLGYFLISFTLISPKCVVISDEKNQKEEMNNAASSLGEHILWKKIEKTKEVIDKTYDLIHTLQDSLDHAKQLVHTVTHLGVTDLSEELLTIYDVKNDMEAYVSRVPDHPYSVGIQHLYQQGNVAVAAKTLADFLYVTEALPTDPDAFRQLAVGQLTLRTYYHEFADKRALQVAQAYRKWAKQYRKKGTELSQNVLQDRRLTMTDLERIETQRIAQHYITLSYEFVEKSDSILLSVQERGDPLKTQSHRLVSQYLQLKQYFDDE